jgi:hypothetical protein
MLMVRVMVVNATFSNISVKYSGGQFYFLIGVQRKLVYPMPD